jgi:hypothetical protein
VVLHHVCVKPAPGCTPRLQWSLVVAWSSTHSSTAGFVRGHRAPLCIKNQGGSWHHLASGMGGACGPPGASSTPDLPPASGRRVSARDVPHMRKYRRAARLGCSGARWSPGVRQSAVATAGFVRGNRAPAVSSHDQPTTGGSTETPGHHPPQAGGLHTAYRIRAVTGIRSIAAHAQSRPTGCPSPCPFPGWTPVASASQLPFGVWLVLPGTTRLPSQDPQGPRAGARSGCSDALALVAGSS